MLRWLLACVLPFAALAASPEDASDASCMLQAHRSSEAHPGHQDLQEALGEKEVCNGKDPNVLNFESFNHGDEIKPDSIQGVTITAVRRATEPQVGQPECPGPLLVLDTNGRTIDKDLQACGQGANNCYFMVWSKDGNTRKVNDCGEHPGVEITIEFPRLHRLVDIEIWDLEEPTFIDVFGKDDLLLKHVHAPSGPAQDAKGAIMNLDTGGKNVKKIVVQMGGSGGLRQLRSCSQFTGPIGDPHVFTLDGDRFDVYENGTFSLFQYSGQKIAHPSTASEVDWHLYAHYGGPWWTTQSVLLVDRSMGRFRQALELTAKDCQWRSRTGENGDWVEISKPSTLSLLEGEEHVSSFEFSDPTNLVLRMKTEKGLKDTLALRTICKRGVINMRVNLPNVAERRFLKGQIEVGNAQKQEMYATSQDWTALGGSTMASEFLQHLEKKMFLQTSCTGAVKKNAEQICAKHLGEHMRDADGTDAQIFADCVTDVCRGGEDFAAVTAELLSEA